jgi:hypothetical protein
LLLSSSTASGASFYVSPEGSDSQSGTLDRPFATPQRALQAAREVRDEPKTIYLRGGVYRLTEPLRLHPEDGGTAAAPLTLSAWQNEQPILSGGRTISGWQIGNDGVWRTTIESVRNGTWKFNELFVDGVRATRARHPNEGYLRVETVGADKRTSFTYTAGDIPALKRVDGTEIVFLHDWSISRVPVASITPSNRTIQSASNIGPFANHYAMDHFEPHPRYFLENNSAFFDAPGEWYLDTVTGGLAYKPLAGQQPNAVQVVAPALTSLLTIAGQYDRPVEHVRIENIRFEHCAYDYGKRYAGGQATFHEENEPAKRIPVPAAVAIDRGREITLIGMEVAHVGGSGVWISGLSRSIEVSRLHVHDTGANGLMIGKPDFKTVGDGFEPVTSRVHVADSVFERPGRRFFGAVGVWIGISDHVTFEHNLVRFTPYTGISMGWRWKDEPTPAHDIVIVNNDIHHAMQELSDGGGIYSLGRMPNSKIIGNVIHDIPPNAGRAESNGIFCDEGTSGLLIEDNIVFNTARAPFRFHAVGNNISRGNLLAYPVGQPIYRYNGNVDQHVTRDNDRSISADQFDVTTVRDRMQAAGPR